jgi:transcriptional regulator with XRE-family HTH domain
MTARLALSARVGRRLRELRVAADVSLERLAGQVGVSKGLLLAIEEGVERPTIATLENLARALRVSLVDLIQATRAGSPVSASRERSRQSRAAAPAPRGLPTLHSIEEIAQAIAALPDSVGDKLEAVDLAAVKHAMAVCGGNRSAAARVLGIERKAVIRRWDKTKRPRKTVGRR